MLTFTGATAGAALTDTVAVPDTFVSFLDVTVKATSKTNDKVSGTATVTIKGQTGTEAKVTGVTVAPKTANVVKGKTQQFTATVAGTGLAAADKAVTWTVAGAKSTATKIDAPSGFFLFHLPLL